ncbi:MAG: dihydrolipoyllysine-residue acetyltransferase, partial [Pseudomonadota bacterium]
MSQTIEITVPDIGNYHDVDVIEVLVQPGQQIAKDSALLTLETDKATMEVPSSHAGVVKEVRIKVGDKVSQGNVVCLLEVSEAGAAEVAPAPIAAAAAPAPVAAPAPIATPAPPAQLAPAPASSAPAKVDEATFRTAHASPSVRKFARELGVDLGTVNG